MKGILNMTKGSTNMTAQHNDRSMMDKIFGGKTRKERLMCLSLIAVYTAIAFLMCAKALPYTTLALGSPLSDALLCAAGAYTPFVFLGNVIGTVYYGHASISRFLSLALAFVLRIITSSRAANSEKAFCEPPVTKLALSAITSMVTCAMYLAVNGISAETARVTLATLITLPTLTLIFSIYFKKPTETKTMRYLYELAMLALFSFAVYCATGITYAFCSLGTLLAIFLTLCVAKYGGFARGSVYGFVLGYIASPSNFLAFLVLGASSALIFSFGTFSATGISALVTCVTAVLVNGASALVSFVPETVIATAIATPILKYGFIPRGFPYPFASSDNSDFTDASAALLAHLSSWRSVRRISDGFSALAKNVHSIADASGVSDEGAERILENLCSGLCESCSMCPICLDTEAERTHNAMKELISHSASGSTEHIPPYLSAHCIKLRELTEKVNSETARLPKRCAIEAEPLLLSYSSVSSLLSAIAEKSERELIFDRDAESAVAKALYSAGVPFSRVSVIGSTRKKVYIYGVGAGKLKRAMPELSKSLKRIFGRAYLAPSFDNSAEPTALLEPAKALQAEVALSSSCKSGESVNGDTAVSFGDGDGNLYALISDGMGSGATAEKSSALTAELIKSLMLCKIDGKNAALLTGEALSKLCDECFATVDLLKLDLVNASATVTKSHAAASYLLRNGSVYCCSSESMPVGINRDAEATEIDFSIADGDTVIMVSDGIAEGPQDSVKITDMLGLFGNISAKELADKIISKALEIKGGSDDMSAMVIKIKKAS